MSIRTEEQLNQALSSELAWRKKELSAIKLLAEDKNISYAQRNALIRSGVALLYAHWEGFIKAASALYLEFVSFQRLKYEELALNFLALCLKGKMKQVAGTNKIAPHIDIAGFFYNDLSLQSDIPYVGVIRTANLSSEILKDITDILGLDYTLYEPLNNLIDVRLLDGRNNIAHGSYLNIDLQSYIEMQSKIIILIDTFRNQIENSATMKLYKK